MTRWLIDKSALVRLVSSPDAELWLQRAERGLVHIATATLLEIGYSARSKESYSHLVLGPPVSAFLTEPMSPAGEFRAVEVQALLVDRGHHRAPSVRDLLIAALAEVAELTVLHVDKDYELIAEATGQAVERLRL